jgi:predicted HicB family RNase H-like nuclease
MNKYKGYAGQVEYDPEEGTFQGKVVGTRDIVTFQGDSIEELQREFERSVDVYLEVCQEIGKDPDRPYPGRFVIEVDPAVQRDLAALAAVEGLSLREFAAQLLSSVTGRPLSGKTKPPKVRSGRVGRPAKRRKGSGHAGLYGHGATYYPGDPGGVGGGTPKKARPATRTTK